MSNIKISNLPLIPSVSPDDVLPIVDSGFTTTYKVKVSSLAGTSGTSGISGSSGTSGTSGLGWNWQGGWSVASIYYKNDVVYYNGSSYVALNTIQAGGNPPDLNASWEYVAIAGSSGSSGVNGTSGTSGVSGTSGTSGLPGSSGTSGTSGVSGSSGTSGTSGISGSSGTSGTSGISGSSGTSGTSGVSVDVYSGGTPIILGVSVMNFSGATITSGGTGQANITITPASTSPFIDGTGLYSIVSKNLSPSNASGNYSLAGGDNINLAGDVSSFAWGKNLSTTTGGEPGKAIFGTGNSSNGGGNNFTWGTACANPSYYSIVGGSQSSTASGANAAIVLGNYNRNFVNEAVIIGGVDGVNYSVRGGGIAGYSNTISNGAGSSCFWLAGNNNTISSGVVGGLLLGGSGSTIGANVSRSIGIGLIDRTITGNSTTYVETLETLTRNIKSPNNGALYLNASNPPVAFSASTYSIYCGTFDASAGSSNYAFAIGSNNNTNSLGAGSNNNYAFQFGANNTQRGSSGIYMFGNTHYANQASFVMLVGTSNSANNTDKCLFVGNSNSSEGAYQTLMVGNSNTISGGLDMAVVGNTNTINNIRYGGIFGGQNNKLSASTNTDFSVILGGQRNEIRTNTSNQFIVDGSGNTITSTGVRNGIISGSGNTIGSSYEHAVIIGGSGRSANNSNTTHIENLHIFRTPSTQVQAETSGTTFTYNLNNGAKAQFYLTGASTIDITNVRDGASFLLKTTTDGGHSITWTSTGYTFKWAGGSSAPGNNKTDLWRFEVFGSVIFGELISDFS